MIAWKMQTSKLIRRVKSKNKLNLELCFRVIILAKASYQATEPMKTKRIIKSTQTWLVSFIR